MKAEIKKYRVKLTLENTDNVEKYIKPLKRSFFTVEAKSEQEAIKKAKLLDRSLMPCVKREAKIINP